MAWNGTLARAGGMDPHVTFALARVGVQDLPVPHTTAVP
jgi:hypothetical protein